MYITTSLSTFVGASVRSSVGVFVEVSVRASTDLRFVAPGKNNCFFLYSKVLL